MEPSAGQWKKWYGTIFPLIGAEAHGRARGAGRRTSAWAGECRGERAVATLRGFTGTGVRLNFGGIRGARGVMTRARARWLGAFLGGAIAVFLLANVAVVLAEQRLAPVDDYYDVHAQEVVSDMKRLEAAGVRSDVVLVGTSQMARGGVPRAIERELGRPNIHNVALPGASTPVVKSWLLNEVEPRLHPKRVVWGISSIDFNGGRPNQVIANYDSARATRPGALGDADRELASMVPIARRRSDLRQPIQLAKNLRAGAPEEVHASKPLDRLLGPMRTNRGKKLKRAASYLRRQQLADFVATPRYVHAFASTLQDLRDQDVETVVVVMPVPAAFRDAHPGGAAQYEQWKRMAIATARASGAKVLDLNDTRPDADFPDYVHLERHAAEDWSRDLGRDLRDLGWGAPGSGSP
jgi:hypothetical protein